MMTSQLPVKLTYQRDGTVPPVYVAGTFSSPPWQPLEMDVSQDENGQNIFSKVIDVSEGTDVQYKFRIGTGDWWVCNESAETVQDDQGYTNNILRASSIHFDKNSVDSSPSTDSPMEKHPQTPPDIPNTAGKLNIDKPTSVSGGNGSLADPSYPTCPMLPHEYVAVPDEDEGYDETLEATEGHMDDYQQSKLSETKQYDYTQDTVIDLDDPMLEIFPSDSASIMATIRRLSTSVDEDRALPQGIAPSLMVYPLKSSTDDSSNTENLAIPQASQSRAENKRNSRSTSRGSMISLNSIAEGDDDENSDEGSNDSLERGATSVVQHPASLVELTSATKTQPGEKEGYIDKGKGPASDDDEGIAMCTVAEDRQAEGSLDGTDIIIPEPVGHLRHPSSHIVEPTLQSSTPLPEEDRFDSAETISPSGLAINHAREGSPHILISSTPKNSNQDSLPKDNTDRPISRSSINSLHDVKGGTNWLQVFIHVLLVDWIGGFISRLWPGKRTT